MMNNLNETYAHPDYRKMIEAENISGKENILRAFPPINYMDESPEISQTLQQWHDEIELYIKETEEREEKLQKIIADDFEISKYNNHKAPQTDTWEYYDDEREWGRAIDIVHLIIFDAIFKHKKNCGRDLLHRVECMTLLHNNTSLQGEYNKDCGEALSTLLWTVFYRDVNRIREYATSPIDIMLMKSLNHLPYIFNVINHERRTLFDTLSNYENTFHNWFPYHADLVDLNVFKFQTEYLTDDRFRIDYIREIHNNLARINYISGAPELTAFHF